MQTRSTLVLLALLAGPVFATVNAGVYLSDGNTPLALRDPNVPHVYRDIMAGTKLCIVVDSNIGQPVRGRISMSLDDLWKGELYGRDFNDALPTPNYVSSCLPEASVGANVILTYEASTNTVGYSFKTGRSPQPGRWFIWDYLAKAAGSCEIGIAGSAGIPPGADAFALTLSFDQVPSRDFNGDTVVNFRDFALFSQRWRTKPEADPNSLSFSSDLDADGRVGTRDLILLNRFWLDRTDVKALIPDPNTSSPAVDP